MIQQQSSGHFGVDMEPTKEGASASTPSFVSLPLSVIHESELNPRKTFSAASMADLTASIRESGVWTPITVRPRGRFYVSQGTLEGSRIRYVAVKNIVGRENLLETHSHRTEEENQASAEEAARKLNDEAGYEIAAGHRRFRAAHAAGLAEIPAIVREMSDQAFAELITFENLGREDVHPLEEADGFASLIHRYGYTAASIAEKIGCAPSYVHKRLQLAKLIKTARAAFEDGTITLQHAVQIARLEPDQQKEAFALCTEKEWDHKAGVQIQMVVSAKVLDLRIREQLFLNLSAAPWKKDDATLLPRAGACTTCPKRTGANHELFDDVDKGDNCLDGDCFQAKRQAFIKITTTAHAKETGRPMRRVATQWCSDTKKLDCLQSQSYTQIKKDRCAQVEKAIVVYGNNLGQVIEICAAPKCQKHGNATVGQYGSYKRSEKEIAAERKRKTEAKIEDAYKNTLWRRLWTRLSSLDPERSEWEIVAEALINRLGHDGTKALVPLLALEPVKEKSTYGQVHSNYHKPLSAFVKQLPDDELPSFCVALALGWQLLGWSGRVDEIGKYAKTLKLDPVAIRKEVSTPILAAAKKRAVRENAKPKEAAKKSAQKVAADKTAPAADCCSDQEDE